MLRAAAPGDGRAAAERHDEALSTEGT